MVISDITWMAWREDERRQQWAALLRYAGCADLACDVSLTEEPGLFDRYWLLWHNGCSYRIDPRAGGYRPGVQPTPLGLGEPISAALALQHPPVGDRPRNV